MDRNAIRLRVYIDIDGTILFEPRDGTEREDLDFQLICDGLAEFLAFVSAHCEPYWLSYRTRLGSVQALEERLFDHLPEIARSIPAAGWTGFKHEAIDLDSNFVWFEDGLDDVDREFLTTHGRLDAFVTVDMTNRRNPILMLDAVKARLAATGPSKPAPPPTPGTAAAALPVRRRLIFLDFDGVLHADGEEVFAKLELFERYLAQMPDAQIVISSSWRQAHDVEFLKSVFSPSLRHRIVGITPTLDDGYDPGGRQREIEAFLRDARLDGDSASWIALDDAAFYFDDNCPHLVVVPAERAFGEAEGCVLLEWYAAAGSGAPVPTTIV